MGVERKQGKIRVDLDDGRYFLTPAEEAALRDFFLKEFFGKHGWVIDSENPNLIVLPRPHETHSVLGGCAVVTDLRDGNSRACWEKGSNCYDELDQAVGRYFAANPTWHAAQPGQLWRVQIVDESHPAFVISNGEGDPIFVFDDGSDLHITDPNIITATRMQIANED